MTMKAAALQYFDAGIQIAACQDRTKLIAQASFADRSSVESFWDAHPDANIAIRTGAVNNLLVVDVDYIRSANPAINEMGAFDTFQARYGTLPATVKANTPRGGFHLYYRYVGAAPVTSPRVFTGIDLRGDGQYVTVPPSLSTRGVPYAWVGSNLIGNWETLTAAPSWLVEVGTDNWPEIWPVPEFTTPYDRPCWLHAMRKQEETAGKARTDFVAEDWSATQTFFEQAVASASRWKDVRANLVEEVVLAVDTVTVTTG